MLDEIWMGHALLGLAFASLVWLGNCKTQNHLKLLQFDVLSSCFYPK